MQTQFYQKPIPVDRLSGKTAPIQRFLDSIDSVRQTGPDRWIARCPAHDDRHPSLSIRECADGTLLLKCWTGCTAAEIVAAVGLELRDLFPPPDRYHPHPRERRPWNPLDVLRCLVTEAHVVALAAEDLAAGRVLSDEDRDRLALAAKRLATALTVVEGL